MKQLFSISHTLKLSVVGAIFVVCNTVWSQSVSTTVIASPAITAGPATSVFSNVSAGSANTTQAAGAPMPTMAQPINLGDAKASAKGGDASLPADAKGTDATLPADAKSAAEDAQLNADPRKIAAASEIEFQRFVRSATGQSLGLFGFELFGNRNSFSSVQGASVPAGYVFGPGDELMVQVNGLVELSQRFVIDRDGRVMVPKVGPLVLAGVQFADVEKVLTAHIGKVYRNFSVSVTMGRLRSIELFVVGQARAPGKHLVSSLSSLINALFETGGPSSNGSLRAIELRRQGKTISTVDMYAFLSKGDNSGDVKLLSGDVIYIPPAGPRAALLGTINHPAIYELLPADTINSVLALTGGLPTLAAPQKAQLERVESSRDVARYVEDFALDAKGMALPLKAGDILTVFQISPQIANVVTLQGNVASPLRYTFNPGMRVSDLLQDKRLLIPGSYWLQINQGATTGNYSRPEVNLDYATIQRLDPVTLRTTVVAFNLAKAVAQDPTENLALVTGDIVTVYGPNAAGTETENSITITGEVVGGTKRFVWRKGFTIKDIIPSSQWLIDYYSYWQRPSGKSLLNDINWNYAQVIRRIPSTLGSQAITFNLGRAVLQGSPADNIALEPGDQISLFTTAQLAQPTERRTMLVTVSGEVAVPGVYQIKPGETLPQLLRRIGGIMTQAYIYGTYFARESVRARQQENLDTLVRKLEAQIQSQQSSANVLSIAADSTSGAAVAQGQQAQLQAQLGRLRSFKSNGRLSLELDPKNNSLAALPEIPLEDGDRINIPVTPGFVTAFGSVNNENAVIYKPGKTVGDVVKSAGLTEDAEADQAFVLRADGTVIAKRESGGLFAGGFEGIPVMPGDTLVVPAQVDRETRYNFVTRALRDWSQIFLNFGLGTAALKTLKTL